MAKKALSRLILLHGFLLVSLVFSQPVWAATTISSPAAGSCYKGGSALSIIWSSDDGSYAHGSISYGGSVLAHPAFSPYAWTLPSSTGSSFQVYVESHDFGHTVLSNSTNTFSIDSSAPSAPSLSISSKTSNSVSLSWTASTNAGCNSSTSYRVFRDNQVIASTTAISFNDSGLAPSTAYTYRVQAYDDFHATDSNNFVATTNSPPASNTQPNSSSDSSPADNTTSNTSKNEAAADTDVDTKDESETNEEPVNPNTNNDEAATAITNKQAGQSVFVRILPFLLVFTALAGLGLLAVPVYRYIKSKQHTKLE